MYERKKLKLALGGKWHSGRPITTPLVLSGNDIVYNKPNNDYLDDFLVFNFSASNSWNIGAKSTLQVNASVLNLFNKNNIVNRYYRTNNVINTIESVASYALGRTPNLSVRIGF